MERSMRSMSIETRRSCRVATLSLRSALVAFDRMSDDDFLSILKECVAAMPQKDWRTGLSDVASALLEIELTMRGGEQDIKRFLAAYETASFTPGGCDDETDLLRHIPLRTGDIEFLKDAAETLSVVSSRLHDCVTVCGGEAPSMLEVCETVTRAAMEVQVRTEQLATARTLVFRLFAALWTSTVSGETPGAAMGGFSN
jgi:hypothetical protein